MMTSIAMHSDATNNANGMAKRLPMGLRLPVIGSPMFIVSNPETVIAQSIGGVVGTFPVLNARPQEELSVWLARIDSALREARKEGNPNVAPYGVNLVIRADSDRLEADIETCARSRVPIIITSLGAPTEIVKRVHDYGGLVLHDVTSVRHAHRALEAGVDGLILVCAGAGGHAGALSPFALLAEVRSFYDGLIILGGAISNGRAILAAQVLGADLVYMGTRFIATQESSAATAYKEMLVQATAADIVYTPHFSGIPANYLKPSILAAGLDPDRLPAIDAAEVRARSERQKRWKDVWGAGQGVGSINDLPPIGELIDRLATEYETACNEWYEKLGPRSPR